MVHKRDRWRWSLLLPLAAGCAASPPTARPAPEPRPAPSSAKYTLSPDAAALRTADRMTLTGLELGTMWTFEDPPLEYWSESYDFSPSAEWLEHVRLASLRFGEICSAAFVSANGLAMTNHHCSRPCIEASSSRSADYVERGFYANRRTDERLCPDLWLDQLVGIEDVTQRVTSALTVSPQAERAHQATALAREQAAIRRDCERGSDTICQVVALHHGVRYMLYRYRRYPAVKLVFAPELQAGFFGGDPDNFTYPRHALDVSFVRAYEADGVTPAQTPEFFEWRPEGASEGELVFVTGNPASTSRLITVSQLLYERVYRHPFIIQVYRGERDLLERLAERSPYAADETRQDIFEIENGLKSFTGQLAGLNDSLLVGTKVRWERELRAAVEAEPKLRAEFGDVWERIEALQWTKLEIAPRLNVSNLELVGSPHLAWAAQLVEYIEQMALPEAERSPDFRRERTRLEAMLSTQAPLDERFALEALALHIELARNWLEADDPLRTALLRTGEQPEDAAWRMTSASTVLDAATRIKLLEGGMVALHRSDDPIIAFARIARQHYRTLRVEWNETLAAEAIEKRRLAHALVAVRSTDFPPDATFTLRISDGHVARYPANGTVQASVTTFYGIYARAAEFANEMPWTLPPSFEEARGRVRMETPLNFVATTDITGGNSGSPIIDRAGRVVGVAFDTNIEQLPNEFLYRRDAARTIGVHSAGILEALRSVYRASSLVAELLAADAEADPPRRQFEPPSKLREP
jgi:hypothetical protein